MRVLAQTLDLSTGAFVQSELFDEVTLDHFVETQRDWRPMIVEATKSMMKRGVDAKLQPRHWHWNWGKQGAAAQAVRAQLLRDRIRRPENVARRFVRSIALERRKNYGVGVTDSMEPFRHTQTMENRENWVFVP